MEKLQKDYKENLEKELKRRKMRIIRDLGVVLLSIIFATYLFVFEGRTNVNMLLIIVLVGYAVITLYGLRKKLKLYYSYYDELRVKKGHIVKYNPKKGRVVLRIPFESITGVYTNIKNMPYTLYVLYETDGENKGEGFYKTRIKDEDKFNRFLKKRDLLNEEYFGLDDLMEIIKK